MAVFQEMLTPFSDGHVCVFDMENDAGFLGGRLGEMWDFWAAEHEGNPVGENPADPRGVFVAEMQDYVLSDVLDGDGKAPFTACCTGGRWAETSVISTFIK